MSRAHVARLWEMASDDGHALMRATQRVADAVNRALRPDGLNLTHATGEAAGQAVFRVHLHVVPRWFDDGFRSPLADTAARIRAHL